MLVFHSKVYISLFFCVLELCFWYSLCVDCLQALCCQRDLSKGTKVTRRHWTYEKWKQSSYSSQSRGLKSSEQHPSDANVMLCFSVRGSHICRWLAVDRKRGRNSWTKKKMGNQIRKSCFFTIGSASQWNVKGAILSLLRHTKMLTVNDIFIVDSQSFYRLCDKMPSFHSLGIPLWS